MTTRGKHAPEIFNRAPVKDGSALPCPFCGSLYLKLDSICWHEIWKVECMEGECGCEGPVAQTEKEALARWNKRRAHKRAAA